MQVTILEKLCNLLGWQGGNIHQVKEQINIITRHENLVMFRFGKKMYCANRFGLIVKVVKGACEGYLKDKEIVKWFLEQVGAKELDTIGCKIIYCYSN
jgi:hypothetical protein